MKNLHKPVIILISALIFVIAACNSKSTKPVKTEGSPLVRVEVSINGMTCTDCENIIQTNVSKLEGIKTIKAVYTTGKATVDYYPDKVDTSGIRAAINKTGYSVADFLPLSVNDTIK